jgi:DNA-binding NarL/FixJ family response regulator
VLRLVSQGYSDRKIVAKLEVSTKTIEVRKANAMRKLGLNGRSELLRFALPRLAARSVDVVRS